MLRTSRVFVRFVVLLLLRCSDAFLPFGISGVRTWPSCPAAQPAFQHLRKLELDLSSPGSMLCLVSEQVQDDEPSQGITIRDRLRKATGFSLTAFRAAWRAATGMSLTAIYATALAASGLWIRKITSVFLSIFPAWFRYFVQPFLIAYYLPMFIIRGLTGPTRKQAKAHHEAVKESWKDAVEFAKQAKIQGYWPVNISENGDFELNFPPNPKHSMSEDLAEAVAESVELAREQGYKPKDLPE